MLDQDFLVRADFCVAGPGFFEQQVFSPQCPAILGPRTAVIRFYLCTEEIQKPSPRFARTTDEFQIFVAHPDD